MRGFWPDERVEGGSWPQSSLLYRAVYRRVKGMEADLLAGADAIVSLTEAGKAVLEADGVAAPVHVIPCCADFDHFRLPGPADRQASRAALGIAPDAPVLVYLGSFGSWYMHEEMLGFFTVYRARRPATRFLIVTQDPPGPILAEAAAKGIAPEALVIRPATRQQVPEMLAAADTGLFFIAPVPSKRASSPTKMAELMATGLAIVTNSGVGDVAAIIDETGCGVAIDRFDPDAYADAIDRLERIDRTPERIRAEGLARFDAAEGIRRYDRIYRAL
jgi:glycosyltransferase involved in cell wall biosynthesis